MPNSIYFTINGKTYSMPDYFSHAICATEILENCNKKTRSAIVDTPAYYLGAQGGDVFFAYNLTPNKNNLGKRLHSVNPQTLFFHLLQGNASYACGFATHYALDCTLHPIIYAYERQKRSPLTHAKLEADIGLYISRKFGVTRKILSKEGISASTFKVYDSIVKVFPEVTLCGVERCLKRHFAISRELFKHKRTRYITDYDLPSLSGCIDEAIAFGVDCVECIACGTAPPELFSAPFTVEEEQNTLS